MPTSSAFRVRFAIVGIFSLLALAFLLSPGSAQPGRPPGGIGGMPGRPPGGVGGMPGAGMPGMPGRPPGMPGAPGAPGGPGMAVFGQASLFGGGQQNIGGMPGGVG